MLVSLPESVVAVTQNPLNYSAVLLTNTPESPAVSLLDNDNWILCHMFTSAPHNKHALAKLVPVIQAYRSCIIQLNPDVDTASDMFLAGVVLGICRSIGKPSLILALDGLSLTSEALYGATAICHTVADLQFFLDTLAMKLSIADITTRLKVCLNILQQTRGVL